MARLFLTRVQCNTTSGGEIQLSVGPHVLMPYTNIDAANPKDYGEGQEPFCDFCGSVTINLENNGCLEGGGSTDSILAYTQSSTGNIVYTAEGCSGDYTLHYSVIEGFPGSVICYINGVARLIGEFVQLTAIFVLNLLILISAPFRRLFGRGNQSRE